MLVLAVDTATPAVTAGVVTVPDGDAPRELARRVTVDARAHGELLMPHIAHALARAAVSRSALTAVVCGVGPGPFTGLRAGMVTAAALGHALELPVHPVCSLDAIAAGALATSSGPAGPLLVATDARRGEIYWATYGTDGARLTGPAVDRPAAVAERIAGSGVTRAAGAGARAFATVLELPVLDADHPEPEGLVRAALPALRAGTEPAPLVPLYLRRPDAAEPGARKRVTAP